MGMEIDFGAMEFETGEDRRAREEREAMDRLRMRIAERDAQRGLVPTVDAVFPPELARGAGAPPSPMPESPDLLAMPSGGSGPPPPSSSPTPPMDQGPPAISTSPQPPPPTADASINPNAQTVTAGAQAADLRQRGGQPVAPIGGQTGIERGASPALQAMQATREGPTFDDRRGAARDEDERRRRIRGVLMGLAALGGMRTIGSGGSMGGALPGLIAAGMVRRPDEEATLMSADAREREMGAAEAEQQSVAARLQQQRDAQESEDLARRQRLLLDMEKLRGDQEDRGLRTGIELRENEREEDLLDPASAVSGRERSALRSSLANQPREVQAAYPSATLDGLAAEELRSIRDQLERGGRARTIAGNGRSSGAFSGSSSSGGLAGAGIAPAWFVASVAEGNGRDPNRPDPEDRDAANALWAEMKPRERARMTASADARHGSETLGRASLLEGYQQRGGGRISDANTQSAVNAARSRDAINAQVDRGLEALDDFAAQSGVEQLGGVVTDAVGVSANDAVAQYNSARNGVIAQLNRAREAGVLNEGEYQRMIEQLPPISSVAGLVGARRALVQVRNEMDALAEANIAASGYERAPRPPRGQRQGGGVRIRFRDAEGNEHRVTVRAEHADQIRAVIQRDGGEVL